MLSLSERNEETLRSSDIEVQEAEKSSERLILKQLPKNLKHAFLGVEKSKLVIITANLTSEKEHKLVETLRK